MKTNTRQFSWPFSLLAVAVALAQPALAEERQENEASKEEKVSLSATVIKGDVLGQATDEEVRTYSGSRSVVKAEDLEKASVRGLDDALQRVPGVKIFDETGTGVLPQISVRGLYESRSGRVQVLSDGIPLSLSPYGQTSLSLFPQTLATVERIDIVRGGAAVQYGPNNVGGVINFISKPIPKKWEHNLAERITFYEGGHQLYDTYFSTGGQVTDSLGLFFEYNTKSGHYERDNSDTDVENIRLRGQWDIDENRSLSFGVQRYDADMELAGALSKDDYNDDRRDSTRPLDRFEGDTDRLWGTYKQYLGSIGFADDVEFSFTSFGHHDYRNFYVGLDSKRTFNPANPPAYEQDAPRDYKVWGLEPRVSFTIYGDKVNQTWLIGGRYVREDTEFEVYREDLKTGSVTTVRDWDFDTEGKATYISNAISMLDGRLTVTPGIRHERVHQDYSDAVSGKKTENLDDEWLPGLTVGYQITDDWFLFANAQRSLRVPQITTIVYDGDVSSEVAWNYEAGFRYTPLPNLRYDFNLYRIDFDDQIVFQDGAWKNVGSTRQQGFETELFWTPAAMPNLDLHASYAFLDAKIRTGQHEGNEVPYASQSQFNVDGRWRFAEGWTYTLDGLYVSEAYSDDANHREENATGSYGELPSYWIWNTSLERKFKLKESELTTSLGVSNLFGREYYFRGIDTSPMGRQPGPGRAFTVAANYRF
ncbi:TonB-dependent receptor family protein [Azotobacter chroococcum]|uniref:Fe(3+) dicitrate transport protein n=1 Tax=Azotobacter chroococcum TaxID=353 RepID=A0A4R1PRY9_9GAMM|nr:TonB-dependent siderophore receptor [Azotobacter chroococcum]TBV96096.1 TonB-dependent siderophore receptor [Azotobacter chroococcum]TCL34383.1 Fe(3+) dicitrate transport protein [Azotobacter chroococcum]